MLAAWRVRTVERLRWLGCSSEPGWTRGGSLWMQVAPESKKPHLGAWGFTGHWLLSRHAKKIEAGADLGATVGEKGVLVSISELITH